MEYQVGEIVKLKKAHPCGSQEKEEEEYVRYKGI